MSSTEHDDFPADEDYRSLSVSAVVTAVVGLLSPAVLVWPLLVVLPCLTVVLAVVSLRGIARSGAAGRGLALFGLVVALLSLGLWGGYQTTYRQRVHAQAAPTADKMLELISEGQTQGAFLLTLGPQERGAMAAYFSSPERHPDDHSDEHPEGEHSPEDQLQDFLEIPAVAQLVASAPLKSWKLTSRSAVQPRPAGRLSVAQTYEVQPAKGPTRRYAIGLEGFTPPNSPPIWRVIGVQPAEAVAL